jgi:hypothetical protein
MAALAGTGAAELGGPISAGALQQLPHGRDVEPHVVEWEADPDDDGSRKRLTSITLRMRSMLPWPPHWTSSTPSGRSDRASRAQSLA